jgi:hypothetical protein
MAMKTQLCVIAVASLLAAGSARGQAKMPAETRNAALRYWMAFAEMKDPPSDKDTQELLDKTSTGDLPWDETRLGPILNANMAAIEMLQRGTKLPDCDWGLEYSRGYRASVAYAPRARLLARLNTLEGMRQMAEGQTEEAVQTWLAGLRFAGHLAKGGSLIFTLIAKGVLLPDLQALNEAANHGKLSAAQKQEIAIALRAVPADGFDWSRAWDLEQTAGDQFLDELRRSKDPKGLYESIVGKGAPNACVPPNARDVHAFDRYMAAIRSTLQLPSADTKKKIAESDAEWNEICEAIRNVIPSAQHVNEARIEIVAARETLLQSIQKK